MTGRAAQQLRDRQTGERSPETSRAVALTPVATVGTLRDLLEERKGAIMQALPRGFDVGRFSRVLVTEAQRNPALLNCTKGSLLGACMLSAQLGLEPGPLGAVYLIPRNIHGVQEASFLLGYRGIIQLALRSNRVRRIATDVVRDRDSFHFERGTRQELRHQWDHTSTDERRGAIVASWALVEFTNGGTEFEVLSHDQIEARRRRSSARGGETGPWQTDYPAMARKSAVRALAPYLPLSPDLERGLRADGAVVERLEPDLADSLTPSEREELEPILTEGPAEPASTSPAAVAPSPPPAAAAPPGRRSRAASASGKPSAGPSPVVVDAAASEAPVEIQAPSATSPPTTEPAAPPDELPLNPPNRALPLEAQLLVRIETAHTRLQEARRATVAGEIYRLSGWDSLVNPREWLKTQPLVTLEAIAQDLEAKLG